jgi:hypothetical protein
MQGRAKLRSRALGVETLEDNLEDCQSPADDEVLGLIHARSGIGHPCKDTLSRCPRHSS